jgi:hypothetical protein
MLSGEKVCLCAEGCGFEPKRHCAIVVAFCCVTRVTHTALSIESRPEGLCRLIQISKVYISL